MKIGLFFGTFNPVHNGHFEIVSSIIEKKYVDQVWIVLTPLSPFKQNQKLVSFYHRIKMLEKAFINKKDVFISDIENKLQQPNYTINTLMYLEDIFTVLANLSGNPAISLPLSKNSNGMPFGTQLMAKPFHEAELLNFSHQTINSL